MQFFTSNKSRILSGLTAAVLLLASHASPAQSVALTAGATSTTLPDGRNIPMWGYQCTGTPTGNASCAAANPNAGAGWSPVVITVPYTGTAEASTTTLSITLTNTLTFGSEKIPTSLVIVGQVGGGLGSGGTSVASPPHAGQGVTWPVINPGTTSTPPAQLPRVRSFATEVTVGTPQTLTWSNLRPGTYLIESGSHPSIQVPMGLYGVLVVTTPVNGNVAAQAYPIPVNANDPTTATATASSYDADLPVVLGEIDPVQNLAVAAAVATPGFSETTVWSGQPGGCADPALNGVNPCYPPAVNYSPRYYLVNGVSFDRTTLKNSKLPVLPATTAVNAGKLLVRLVNAGLRMHIPSIVNMPMTLLAEDGNPLPGQPRVQNEVFLAAGKTYDVSIKPAQTTASATGSGYAAATYPLFDRQLSLSTNNQRDGGMQAYIAVAGGSASGVGSSAPGGSGVTATVRGSFAYFCYAGTTLSVTDPSAGLLGGSSGANGVSLGTANLPGTLALNSDGTFTYTPPAPAASLSMSMA
jgi:FtsP/CotA-like multicopper oxidase with cupredoxin domain